MTALRGIGALSALALVGVIWAGAWAWYGVVSLVRGGRAPV